MQPRQGTIERGRLAIPAGLFAAGLILNLIALRFFATIGPDGFIYLELARNLPAEGFTVSGLPEKFLPLYPALIAFFDLISLNRLGLTGWGFAISALSGAMLAPLTYAIARALSATRGAALVMGAAQVLLAVSINESRDVSVLPLYTMLTAFCLWAFARGRPGLAGLFTGLALTTRYEAYFLVPLFFLASLKNRKAWAWFLAGLLIAASPWWVRNLLYHQRLVHTYYMAELMGFQFHLLRLSWGLLVEFGPFALLVGLLGLSRLRRGPLIFFAGYGILYFALHVVWWFYASRFVLPLAPALLAPAALGLDWINERAKQKNLRPAAIAALLILLVLAPAAGRSGFLFYRLAVEPPDPYREAAQYLTRHPAGLGVIGSKRLLLEHYLENPVTSWETIKKGEDPHQFLLRQYRDRNVRLIFWNKHHPVDFERFGFLKAPGDKEVVVETPEGGAVMFYRFLARFERGRDEIFIYDLLVKPAAPE